MERSLPKQLLLELLPGVPGGTPRLAEGYKATDGFIKLMLDYANIYIIIYFNIL